MSNPVTGDPTLPPLPSAWVNFAALNREPEFNCHYFDQMAKLYSMPERYVGAALDIGCRLPGNYQIDFRALVSPYTKGTEYDVLLQLIEYQRKSPVTLYMGGIHAENVTVWISRFAEGTARAKIRQLVGPICDFLDRNKASISLDAMGDLELGALPANTQLQAAYQIWRTEQQVNQCRVAMLALMKTMNWHVKVEAFCPTGYIASNYPSISTDDVRDIPAGYNAALHERLVTGTPDAAKLLARLTAGSAHYIDSALFVAGQPLPVWWPTQPLNPA